MMFRLTLRGVALIGASLGAQALGVQAQAQGGPPFQQQQPQYQQQQQQQPGGGQVSPPANPMCQRLEAQLATVDRGGGDAAKAEQVRRYEDAASRQQGELDRVSQQAKRMGCDSSGFFSLFSGQNAQCGPVNTQIQQMRGNLDQITTSLERLRGGGPGNGERDNQRRSVLLALAQNNCGPQYAAAARNAGGGGFFDNIFGNNGPGAPGAAVPAELGPPSSTFRTVCVRSCDGFYFPISFATVQSRFGDDERTCKNLCPASEANLFSYRNPGEDMNQAVSISGQPYSSSPNAFKYRQEFNPSCSCKAAGQTWADALKTIDEKASIEQGDIIVTEERAKRMSQPQTKGAPAARKATTSAPAAAAAPAPAVDPAAAASDAAAAPSANKPIRSVGPTFIPTR
ncbi:MAG: hypothetical protein JWP21_3218 [Tardiphaga sp.]|nr:hypothetical protein [Tardiphaga sp.]